LALAELAEGKARGELSSRSRLITETYQARRNSSAALLSADDALAYALARMPATFAAVTSALGQLSTAKPDLEPLSLLDVGCGPGTASFSATALFPMLQRIQLLDRNGPFLELARQLSASVLPDQTAVVLAQDIAQPENLPTADLVIASYVLAELPADSRVKLIEQMWKASEMALLLVEPGTPDGHARLMEARRLLLIMGAHLAAPCTHAVPCPMTGDRWCRFFVRVQRSRDHKVLKGGDRPFEDEPFAYLAVTRAAAQARSSHRIVNRPTESKADITLELCGENGIERYVTASRERQIFKQVRRLRWGDPVMIPIQGPKALDEV
jgi:ribosomal protein RSM22 (predicted rRNA methylase)